MKAIYKYQIPIQDEQTIDLPVRATILSCANQYNELCLWALVETTESALEERTIRVYGTGHKIQSEDHNQFDFLGTVLFGNGALVLHVFYIK